VVIATEDMTGHAPNELADVDQALKTLSPLANTIVDRAIDNMTRKLVAGYRNKRNAKPNAKHTDFGAESKEAFKAASAQSVIAVANRGQAWKEMIQKSMTHGISSLATIKLTPAFEIKNGQRPENFKDAIPAAPGVYVVHDKEGTPIYVGDSDNMQSRWNAGHFNEYKQGEREGATRYKLADAFEEGCTVSFIVMESKETAAALEAHLIQENFAAHPGVKRNEKNLTPEQAEARKDALEDGMLLNKKEELATEQGTRSNQEAKKMKDAASGTARLVAGAAGEAMKNVGFDIFERLTTTSIKAIKDELVDILGGGKAKLKTRVERMMTKIFDVIKDLVTNWAQLLRGLAEFLVNALSKTIGQIYNLARNIYDLAMGAWQLYKGAETMSREELVRKITETVIVSGSLVVWDALDAVLETFLSAQFGGALAPFSPYIASTITAVGFGVSTYALQNIATRIIDGVIAFKMGYVETLAAEKAACDQLLRVAETELELMADLGDYVKTSVELTVQMEQHTILLSNHEPIEELDLNNLLTHQA
jgi:hypothetical protein